MSQNTEGLGAVTLTRRRVLGSTAGAAIAAAASLMPPNVRRVLAQDNVSRGAGR